MNLRRLAIPVFGIGGSAGLALAAACSGDDAVHPVPSVDGGGDAADRSPIVIGASAALTGSQSTLGPSTQNALKVVEAQLNAIGGILNRPVVITVVDDGTDTTKTTDVAKTFLGQGVAGFVGPSTSAGALAVHQLFADKKTLIISGLAITPTLTNAEPARDRYFFRTEASATLQARAVALAALHGTNPGQPDNQVCTKLAIVHADDAYGNPVGGELATDFAAAGGTVVDDETIPAAQAQSYADVVAKVAGSGAECQALLMFAGPGDQYMKDFAAYKTDHADRDWTPFLTFGTIPFYSPGFISGGRIDPADPQSPTVVEGMYGAAIDTTPATTEFADYSNLYKSQFPSEAGGVALGPAAVYDAAVLMALAIQAAGPGATRVAIRDKLYEVSQGGTAYGPAKLAEMIDAIKAGQDVDYSGASGACDFDDHGDVLEDHLIWKVKGGAFQVVRHVKAAELGPIVPVTPAVDAGADGGADAGLDAAVDAGRDAAVDAGDGGARHDGGDGGDAGP